MNALGLALVVALGLLHLGAIWWQAEAVRRATKILPILVLLGAVVVAAPVVADPYRWLIAAGLVASIAGDVALLERRRFRAGLSAFLVAHLLYIAAFLLPPSGLPAAPVVLGVALAGLAMLAVLWPRVGAERPAVAIYVGVIVVMALAAWGRVRAGASGAATTAAVGALWFMASDAVLAFDRFVRRFAGAQLVVMATYYTAQTLIARSVWATG